MRNVQAVGDVNHDFIARVRFNQRPRELTVDCVHASGIAIGGATDGFDIPVILSGVLWSAQRRDELTETFVISNLLERVYDEES